VRININNATKKQQNPRKEKKKKNNKIMKENVKNINLELD
jgi:hypothetical protein